MTVADPQREFAVEVVERLRSAGHQALWAGGCVRDLLLGRDPGDYDVATDAVPDQVRALFGRRRTIPVGESFGVIIVRGPETDSNVEVATFRTDGDYSDGRRPDRVHFCTAEEDARRRDFTINGLFFDPIAERVIDYVQGQADLAARVVRAIGDPHDRVREDKLRMLRAVRFAARLQFALDPWTAAAIREMAAEMQVVSVERIAQELRKMLTDPHRRRAVELLHETRLLHEILPELDAAFPIAPSSPAAPDAPPTHVAARILSMLSLLGNAPFETAAAALLHALDPGDADDEAVLRGIGRRLRLSNAETDRIAWLVRNRHVPRLSGSQSLSQRKRLLANPWCDDLLAIARVETLAAGDDPSPLQALERYRRNVSPEVLDPPPLLTGDDLIAGGARPGRQFGPWLEAVREAQLSETIRTPEEAWALIARLRRDAADDTPKGPPAGE